MEMKNKTSFEHGAQPGVNEYRAPPGVIFAFNFDNEAQKK
jgi:hypothetical protein